MTNFPSDNYLNIKQIAYVLLKSWVETHEIFNYVKFLKNYVG